MNLRTLAGAALMALMGAAPGAAAPAAYPTAAKYTTEPAKATGSPATWGALNCHDPALFQDDDGTYWVFSTDASIGGAWKGGIQVRKSADLVHWTCLATPAITQWDPALLAWCGLTASEASSWAPCVVKLNGKYYMYHGIIVSNPATGNEPRAWIGLAIADRPEGPYKAAGTVVRYAWDPASSDLTKACLNGAEGSWNKGFGAIDPSVTFDDRGGLWLTYGSWKGGIAILRLDPKTGLPPGGVPADTVADGYGVKIAGGKGAAYEGACVLNLPSCSFYYLFMSSGDLQTDYSVRIGRRPKADGIAGPYFDSNGFDLTQVDAGNDSDGNFHKHGNKLLGSRQFQGDLGWRAPGGPSVLAAADGKVYLAAHSRTAFQPTYYFYLQVFELRFTPDGWPILDPNEVSGVDQAPVTAADLPGVYDCLQTQRDGYYSSFVDRDGREAPWVNTTDAEETRSQPLTLGSDGRVSGARQGTWDWDGRVLTLTLEPTQKLPAGTYTGTVFRGIDGARKGAKARRETLGLSAFCAATGEYLTANLHG